MRVFGHRLGTAVLWALASAGAACTGATEVSIDCAANTDCAYALENISVFIPAAALPDPLHLVATRVPNPPDSLTVVPGTAWEVEPTGTTFTPRADLILTISADSLARVPQVRRAELGIYKYEVAGWTRVDSQTVDTVNLTISARISGLSLYAVVGAPAASISVSPPSFQLTVPSTQQLTATVRDALNAVLPLRIPTWSTSASNVATVSASGLVTAQAAGGATISASIGNVSGSSNAAVSGGQGTGNPQPQTGDVILMDFRAGGNRDLQSCNDLICATSRVGGRIGAVGFTTNYDGNNTRAYVFPWFRNNGQATCTGNVGSQQDMFIYMAPNVNGFADMYLQYKIWMGRTATGGGTGAVAAYQNINLGPGAPGGHKWFVWFRNPNNSDARMTGEQSPTLWKFIATGYAGYSGPPAGAEGSIGEVHFFGTDVTAGAWNPDNNLNRVNTLTFRIRSETAANAQNGVLEAWANGVLVQGKSNLYTSPLGFQELQLGGPTWICPPQDQTAYVWDILMWRK